MLWKWLFDWSNKAQPEALSRARPPRVETAYGGQGVLAAPMLAVRRCAMAASASALQLAAQLSGGPRGAWQWCHVYLAALAAELGSSAARMPRSRSSEKCRERGGAVRRCAVSRSVASSHVVHGSQRPCSTKSFGSWFVRSIKKPVPQLPSMARPRSSRRAGRLRCLSWHSMATQSMMWRMVR